MGLRLVSITRYALGLEVLTLQWRRWRYSLNIFLTCILYCDAEPSYLVWTVCKRSVLLQILITNIIFIFIQHFFRYCSRFTSRKPHVYVLERHSSVFSINLSETRTMADLARYLELEKAQRDKLPDYKGPLPNVLNCQNGTWPDPTRVSPHSPQGW